MKPSQIDTANVLQGFGHLVNAISQKCLCDSCQNIGCRGVEIPFKGKWTVHECDGYVKGIDDYEYVKPPTKS